MKNNRDSFRPGNKPFSRDSKQNGGYKSNNKSGDFKRNDRNFTNFKNDRNNNRNEQGDRNYSRNNSGSSYKPYGNKKEDYRDKSKSNYSSNYSNFPNRSGYSNRSNNNSNNSNNYSDNSNRPERSERPNYPNRSSSSSNSNYSRNNDGGYNRFEKKFTPAGQKPRFERKFDKPSNFNSDRKDRNFDRPKKFDKPNRFDKVEKFEKDLPVIVSSVEQEDSGMVYGRNAVIELLKSEKSIDKLFVQKGQKEGSITMIFAEAVKKSIPIIEVEKPKLDSMINNSAHQGVIALASEKEYCSVDDILQIAEGRNEKPFILIADKIMDPHNLGAIIRTAECAGVHGIIIPKRNAAGVSPIVAKTSAGASIHMAIAKVANIANTIADLKEKGIWIFSSSLDIDDSDKSDDSDDKKELKELKDYSDMDYDIPLVLIVGNEGEGLTPIIIQKSDFLVRIPMLGKIESLNVSCASAVLMYEVARQRKSK